MTGRLSVGQIHLSPSWAEMADRHRSATRSFLALSRQYGDTPKGRKFLEKARTSARLESQSCTEATCTLLMRDGFPEVAAKHRSGALSAEDVHKFRVAVQEAAVRV